MHTKEWFYCIPGAEVHGPLPIETIRAAVTAGMLSEMVHLGRGSTGPWAPIAVVEKLGDSAFAHGGKLRGKAVKESQAAGQGDRSIGRFIEVFGYLACSAGVLGFVGMLITWNKGSAGVAMMAGFAMAAIVSGLMFLAVSEALKRLREISDAVRKNAEH